MKIYDITRPLFFQDIVYPGDLPPSFRQEVRGLYRISDLNLSSHAGTHIDAPVHYLKTGLKVDEIPLDALIGTCRVLDVSDAKSTISAPFLEKKTDGVQRILLKTAFSGCTTFDPDYPHITLDAAKILTRKNVTCIGIDSPSIESFQCDGSVHRELLGSGCFIIELLDLSSVGGGDYLMAALPLRLSGVDGSPARVILIEKEESESWE